MKKNMTLAAIAALSIQFLASSTSIISPALAGLGEAYPDVPFTTVLLLASIPSLLAIPTSLGAGVLAGRKVSFRSLSLLATSLVTIGGTAPYLIQSNFTLIMICRGVFGLGYGIVIAIMGTLIVRLFEGQQQAKILGIAAVVMAVGGIGMPLIAGILVNISTHLMWLVHLIGGLCFLACFFWLPEPEKTEQSASGEKEKARISGAAWSLIAGYALGTLALYSIFLGASTVVIGEGLGTAASAGLVVSLYFVGSFVGGMLFSRYFKITGKFSMALAYLLGAVGMILAAFGSTLPMILAGSCLVGFGYGGLVVPGTFANLGQILSPASMAVAGGLVGAGANIAGFLTPYWMSLSSSVSGNPSPRASFFAGTFIFVVIAVYFFLKNPTAASSKTSLKGG